MSNYIDRVLAEVDEKYKAEARRRCQTDLLFLGGVLGYTLLLPRVHQPVADLCVKKNPDIPIEELGKNQVRSTLHLDPRGTFKSTLSIVDSVQWIVTYPNVRICKLTATKPLAKAITGEISDHFLARGFDDRTDFLLLFPEFAITKKFEGEYTAPCRTRAWREATVMSFSIETSISGWHFDVIDPDDVVDTQNTSTPQGIKKVKKNWKTNRKTLMPWGFVNAKGTRYDPLDLWGDMIEKAHPKKIKMLVRSAMKIRDGRRLEEGDGFPAETEVELLFPELLSYEFLKGEFEDDYDTFMTQYMNDAYGANEVTFPKELMMKASHEADRVPFVGETFIACKLPGDAAGAIAVGTISDGRMYVTDLIRGKFTPSGFANRIVTTAKRHGIHRVTIEATPGYTREDNTIKNYGAVYGWPIEISWIEAEEDDEAKKVHIKQVEPLLSAGRLLFSDGLTNLAEIHSQFTNFGMSERSEVPAVVALLSDNLPASIVNEHLDAEQEAAWERAKQEDLYDKIHALGSYAPVEPVAVEEPYRPPQNSYGLDSSLGGLDG